MTTDSRVGVLQNLLERIRRNAKLPRRPVVENHVDLPPESLAFDLVPARARTNGAPPPPSNTFVDEPTATGDAEAIENLLVQEQAIAPGKIRFEENPPTTRPPPEPPLATRAPDGDEAPGLAVLEEFENADAAVTEPPPPSPEIPPVSIPSAKLPDLDSIEADLLSASAPPKKTLVDTEEPDEDLPPDSSRTFVHQFVEEPTGERLKSTPRPPPLSADGVEEPSEDEAPSSVRQPRESERAEDMRFDGFEPIETPSEPPPESGEVPSQRRIALGGAFVPDSHPHGRERAAEEPTGDESVSLDRSFDHEETKEVRSLGRVDVVERANIEQPTDIAVQKGEPRVAETFAAVLDEALSLSPAPHH